METRRTTKAGSSKARRSKRKTTRKRANGERTPNGEGMQFQQLPVSKLAKMAAHYNPRTMCVAAAVRCRGTGRGELQVVYVNLDETQERQLGVFLGDRCGG